MKFSDEQIKSFMVIGLDLYLTPLQNTYELCSGKWWLNSLPNDKILDWSKLKAFAGNKIKALKKMNFVFDRVENVKGNGENAGYQHFFLFPQCFQKAFYSGSLKIGIVW